MTNCPCNIVVRVVITIFVTINDHSGPQIIDHVLCPVIFHVGEFYRMLFVRLLMHSIPVLLDNLCWNVPYGPVQVHDDCRRYNGFRVIAARHAADTVREHPLKRDAVLCGFFLFVRPLRPCDGGFDLAAFGAGQRIVKMCLIRIFFLGLSLWRILVLI